MQTYLQLDGAICLALTADRERKGELVPVLLRITAEPESAYECFNTLASYALVKTVKLKPESIEIYFALRASQSITTTRLNLARVKPELHK